MFAFDQSRAPPHTLFLLFLAKQAEAISTGPHLTSTPDTTYLAHSF